MSISSNAHANGVGFYSYMDAGCLAIPQERRRCMKSTFFILFKGFFNTTNY